MQGPNLQVFSPNCVLMRNALSKEEQVALVSYIKDHDRSQFYQALANNPKAQAMAQIKKKVMQAGGENSQETTVQPSSDKSNKSTFRFVFENNNPYINLDTKDDDSIFNQVVKRLNQILQTQVNEHTPPLDVPVVPSSGGRVEVGVQGYEYPHGSLGRHTDRDPSLVYLMSLGCPARFLVKTPGMDTALEFDFENGDVLYFDASPQANVEHAVLCVPKKEAPLELVEKFDYLSNHRLGIQYRLYPNL